MKRILMICIILVGVNSRAFAAGEHCTSVTDLFIPAVGQTHKVAVLNDPAGQQTALFDLSWGGVLVSLKYSGVEYIASPSTIAGSQVRLRSGNYGPTMGGDDMNRGSTVAGAACTTKQLWITSGMTDYYRNALASTAYVFRDNQWTFDQFIAPYVVNTYAYFIPNPTGSPSYYLKVDRTISNIDGTDIDAPENYQYTFDLSTSTPTGFSNFTASPNCQDPFTPCSNTASYVVAGLYDSSALTNGLAVATLPSSQWNSDSGYSYWTVESLGNRRALHLNRVNWTLAPRVGRTHTEYVMVGSWAKASSYASKACTFAVSAPGPTGHPSPHTYLSGAFSQTLTVTSKTGCAWEATNSVPWLTVSPSSGTGTGSVTYTLQANTSGAVRLGNLTIAGTIYPVFQN
jgi:hypothetical protein